MWFLSLAVAACIAMAGHSRANAKEPEAISEKDLPEAVRTTADKYAPQLKIDEVRTREIEGHPKVFVIDGESEDRDVVMHITEEGAILEVRFHDRPEGVKPVKQTHSTEELPATVRETANRIFPAMQVFDVRSHQSPHEVRIYHITGQAVEDGKEREVVLVVEADGDLLEARVFKPRIVSAEEDVDRDNRSKKAKDAFDD